mgnify:FL=1
MIPAQFFAALAEWGIPRESGDDPFQREIVGPVKVYSPRERG